MPSSRGADRTLRHRVRAGRAPRCRCRPDRRCRRRSAPGRPPTVGRAPASRRARAAAAAKTRSTSCSVGTGVTAKQVVVVRVDAVARDGQGVPAARRPASTSSRSVRTRPRRPQRRREEGREARGRRQDAVGHLQAARRLRRHKNPGVRVQLVQDRQPRPLGRRLRRRATTTCTSARRRTAGGPAPRSCEISPAYDYAQVIGYNEKRTPGRGSAIFFHVDTGSGDGRLRLDLAASRC